MINKLKKWYVLNKTKRYLKQCGFTNEQIERKIICANIHSHMKFFKYDLSEFTDEEVEHGMIKFGEFVIKSGVSAYQAMKVFQLTSKCSI